MPLQETQSPEDARKEARSLVDSHVSDLQFVAKTIDCLAMGIKDGTSDFSANFADSLFFMHTCINRLAEAILKDTREALR